MSCTSLCAHDVLPSACRPRKFYILDIVQHTVDSDGPFSESVLRPGLVTMAETQAHHCYIKNYCCNTGARKTLSINSVKFCVAHGRQGGQTIEAVHREPPSRSRRIMKCGEGMKQRHDKLKYLIGIFFH